MYTRIAFLFLFVVGTTACGQLDVPHFEGQENIEQNEPGQSNWADSRSLPPEIAETIEYEKMPGEVASEISSEGTQSTSFQLQSTEELYCPEGFSLDTKLRFCTSETEAIGPFPEQMRLSCAQFGGGQACENDNWSKTFAENLRGDAFCPVGTVRTAEDLCSDGTNAFGPFPRAAVKKCEDLGGGNACYGLRWQLAFAKSLVPKKTSNILAGYSIGIDVGHGNHGPCNCFDPGAVNQFQFKSQTEYVINLKVANKIKENLERLGATVDLDFYPRGSSYFPGLYQRGVNARGNDIFLSIHHNASSAHAAQGSEVFILKNNTAKDTKLGEALQSALVKRLWGGSSNRDRGVKKFSWPVLRGASTGVSAKVLVEAFFMDLPSISESQLRTMIDQESTALTEGIVDYFIN